MTSESQAEIYDACIVGSGPIGVAVADYLLRLGRKVLVIERGPHRGTESLNDVIFNRSYYGGAIEGRLSGVGGTSAVWGGAMLPAQSFELNYHNLLWHSGYSIDRTKFDASLSYIEGIFGVAFNELESSLSSEKHFVLRSAVWPTFKRRNVRNHLLSLSKSPNLTLRSQTQVIDLIYEGQSVAGVKCLGDSGQVEIRARKVVLANGVIESLRLLHYIEVQYQKKFETCLGINKHGVGKNLQDHFSVPVAKITPLSKEARSSLYEKFTFTFDSSGMRNRRLELSEKYRKENGLPGAFLHVSFESNNDNPFQALRRILQGLQKSELPSWRDGYLLIKNISWLVRAVAYNVVKKKVLPPDDCCITLNLVFEQAPSLNNAIYLADKHGDRNDIPVPVIDWSHTDFDVTSLKNFLICLKQSTELASNHFSGCHLDFVSDEDAAELLHGIDGIFHPTGAMRQFSNCPAWKPASCELANLEGVWAVNTGSLCSGTSTSPTLPAMQLAILAAEELHESLNV